jgi:ABC-type transport system substrate-binding protein
MIQHNLQAIGIKLDIENYPFGIFLNSFLPGGKASPPSGAVAGRYDIAESAQGFLYDADDSFLFGCNQLLPIGENTEFYCNHALDALYQQELATVDVGARQQVFRQIHEIYLTQFPFITLYSLTSLSIVRKGTHNYLPSALDPFLNSWQWWCDGGKC